MENKDSTKKMEEIEETASQVTDEESTKTTNNVAGATETQPSEKSTQNGERGLKLPENVDNQNEKSTTEHFKAKELVETESNGKQTEKPPEPNIVEAIKENNMEEKTSRFTRGAKRKATDNEKNESILESADEGTNNKITERKENLDLKNNENFTEEVPSVNALSSSNIMGKGKRARIPNKRYSDILITPNKKSSPAGAGTPRSQEMIEPEESINVKDEFLEAGFAGFDNKVNSTPNPVLSARKKKYNLAKENLQDPKYLKPFKYGWKRELVWRSTSTNSKKIGDIYYYDPNGKKLRSFRDISDNLTNKNLSLDNFSFLKEPLGVNDPEKEIIRNAKVGSSENQSSDSDAAKKFEKRKSINQKIMKPEIEKKPEAENLATAVTPTTSSKKRAATAGMSNVETKVTLTPSSKKRAASAGISNAITKEKETASPISPSKKVRKMPVRKGKTSVTKKLKESESSATEEPMEVESTPTRSNTVKTSKPCQPCSIRCDGLQGIIPTLQCRMCLCLYHYECIGLNPSIIFNNYVCKNCQDQEEISSPSTTIASLPPLTPINSLKTSNPVINTTLPKLQRIPRPDSSDPVPLLQPMVDKIVKSELITPKPQEGSTSLVGAVTSWLPHNVKIVNSAEPKVAPRPQYVEYIGGRKYLVIPKHNFMSVSSNTSRSEDSIIIPNVWQPTEVPIVSASLGPNVESNQEVPEIKSFSPRKQSLIVAEKERKIEDNDIQAVPQENREKNETSARQTLQQAQQPKLQKRNLKLKSITSGNFEEKNENKFMENYLQNLSFGYNTLLYVFQYLKVQDLLRAGCVCTMWRDIASHPILWRTVRMKNSQVHSFEGLANTLKKHNTVHLDLRKMLLPSTGDEIWPEFSKAIAIVDTLRKIELCRCPASVVEQLPISNPNLEVINAVTIKCDTMNLNSFGSLNCIRELRLKSTSGLNVNSLNSLKSLKTLKILSLTSFNDLHKLELNVIADLTNLESLDLGECSDFPKNFGQDILSKLEKLEKLRLEKGQEDCHTFEILDAVKNMKNLEQLELVNFDIKSGFDRALGGCTNLKKLMIIPTYISQSATTNNMVLSGVLRLQGNLTHFVWGVTLELIRVTELFVDQCEDRKEKKPSGNGDSIPVLKPVPDLSNGGVIQAASNPPQVEILPLPNLQKLLLNSLPTTRVKILKIPFHATWRQTLTDSV